MCHFLDVREFIVLKPVIRATSFREKEGLGALSAFRELLAALERERERESWSVFIN
jgi:hypothetical protein